MAATLLRAVRRLRGERGSSLIEMIVVVMLLGIVFSVTTETFISGVRGATDVTSRTNETLDTRQALDRMTQMLQGAVNVPYSSTGAWPAFTVNGPTDVRFFCEPRDYDYATNTHTGGPLQVEYKLVAGAAGLDLTEDVWEPTPLPKPPANTPPWSWPATPTHHRILASDVVDPSPHPMFVYLARQDTGTNPDGTAKTTLGSAVQLAVGNAGLASKPTQPSQTAAVEIWLTVGTNQHPAAAAVPAVTRVQLPNADAVSLTAYRSPTPVAAPPSPSPPPTTKPPSPRPPSPKPSSSPTPSRSKTPSPTPTRSSGKPSPKPSSSSPRPKPSTTSPKPPPRPSPTGPPTPPDPS